MTAEAPTPGATRALAETLLQAGEHAVAAEAFQKVGETLRAAQCLSLAGLNEDFAALRRDETAWEDELRERRAWDATLSDGLED